MQTVSSYWDELVTRLREEEARLNAEVRSYPTPIARCDAQLPGLLEQRREVTAALQLALELRAKVARIAAALEEATTV